jgi:hypothetical protein
MPKCFIIMPISTPKSLLSLYRDDSDHFMHVLNHIFVPAIEKAGFEAILPKVEGADVIHAKIIKNIEQCDLVLCDMSALNPNVFFELGIRTAVDKPACMIVDDITVNVPFDTSIVNYHTYRSNIDPWVLPSEIEKLCSHILATKLDGERNPLWRYFGLSANAHFSEKETGIESKIDLMNIRLNGITRQLLDRGQPIRGSLAIKEPDAEVMLYRMLSEIVINAGYRINNGRASDGVLFLSTDGELPAKLKEELTILAETAGIKLELESRLVTSK